MVCLESKLFQTSVTMFLVIFQNGWKVVKEIIHILQKQVLKSNAFKCLYSYAGV